MAKYFVVCFDLYFIIFLIKRIIFPRSLIQKK